MLTISEILLRNRGLSKSKNIIFSMRYKSLENPAVFTASWVQGLDMGLTHDLARDETEKAAGFGLGLSFYHDSFTLSGTVGVPLIEDNSFEIGDPVFQVRMDVKTW
jgi:hemolysin activation/secretion protein